MMPADPVPGSAVSVLRARLVKLGADPRLKAWPEARATIHEVTAALDELETWRDAAACIDLSGVHPRLEALERRMATLIRLDSADCDS